MRLCRNPIPRPQAPQQESDLLLTTTGGQSGGGKSHQEPGREKSYFPERGRHLASPPLSPNLPGSVQTQPALAGLWLSGCQRVEAISCKSPAAGRAPHRRQTSSARKTQVRSEGHQPAPSLLVHPPPRPQIPVPLQFYFQRWGHP